jgi:hypothetical protein
MYEKNSKLCALFMSLHSLLLIVYERFFYSITKAVQWSPTVKYIKGMAFDHSLKWDEHENERSSLQKETILALSTHFHSNCIWARLTFYHQHKNDMHYHKTSTFKASGARFDLINKYKGRKIVGFMGHFLGSPLILELIVYERLFHFTTNNF